MKRFVWMVLLAFALGFAIAWTAKPVDRISNTASVGEPAGRAAPREPRAATPHQNAAAERVKGYLRKSDEQTAKGVYSSNLFTDMPTGDIPLLIEQWRKRAGFSGLEYNEQFQIRRLAKEWYEKEPDAALAWAAGMECQKDRQALISEMVGAEAKRNFDHALELAKQYGTVALGGLEMPNEVREKLGDGDPARFMEIMRLFPAAGSGRSGGEVEFKENFDFATLAAMLEKADDETKGESYSFFPSNLIKDWAKIDPEAAWNWVSREKGGQMPFSGADDFFSALAATRSKEQINDFVIDQMASRNDDESKFRLAWQALARRPEAAQITDFINRMPGDRGANLEQLVKASSHGSGGPYDEFKEILVTQMTADERMRILPKVFASSSSGDDRRVIAGTLRQLGHTDAEINAMLPK